jgi:hypothetical protein
MGIGIEIANMKEVEEYANGTSVILKGEILSLFKKIGDNCLTLSREHSEALSFIDHTGDLRSSIGYAVACDGVLTAISGFEVVANGAEGAEKGRRLATEIAQSHGKGYILVVVAGEKYASYVEAHEDKVVISDANLYCLNKAEGLVKSLKLPD